MSERDRDEAGAAGSGAETAGGKAQGASGAADAVGPEGGLEARLKAAEAAAAEFRDQVLRAAAELENVRRRASRDVENAHRYGVERFAREMLAVLDSLEMGLEAARGAGESGAVAEGMEATLRLLTSTLERFGVMPVEAAGQPFDPESHEAIMTQPTDAAAPDTVVGVIQQGYRIHDRLLRPARVIVARSPET
jgi:molecular chaperone GrpE